MSTMNWGPHFPFGPDPHPALHSPGRRQIFMGKTCPSGKTIYTWRLLELTITCNVTLTAILPIIPRSQTVPGCDRHANRCFPFFDSLGWSRSLPLVGPIVSDQKKCQLSFLYLLSMHHIMMFRAISKWCDLMSLLWSFFSNTAPMCHSVSSPGRLSAHTASSLAACLPLTLWNQAIRGFVLVHHITF